MFQYHWLIATFTCTYVCVIIYNIYVLWCHSSECWLFCWSLRHGIVPLRLKSAYIEPTLQKAGMHTADQCQRKPKWGPPMAEIFSPQFWTFLVITVSPTTTKYFSHHHPLHWHLRPLKTFHHSLYTPWWGPFTLWALSPPHPVGRFGGGLCQLCSWYKTSLANFQHQHCQSCWNDLYPSSLWHTSRPRTLIVNRHSAYTWCSIIIRSLAFNSII